MSNDGSPTGYTYDEAINVLQHLGFALAPSSGGSHRKWRCIARDGSIVVIGLVDKGAGTLKAYLIRDMIAQLKAHDMIPDSMLEE